jgi:arginyl-tRNA synthetase
MSVTERLTEAMRQALATADLPAPAEVLWEVPRQVEHGDYSSNVAMVLAKPARRSPRQIADAVMKRFPPLEEVAKLEVAGPGFLNVFLAPAWTANALREILDAGARYGQGTREAGQRIRIEFVSANPTGPLVIVNARAAAVGDALARLLRAQGAGVTTEYYINDAGRQFERLALSLEARVRQFVGEEVAIPEGGYAGDYIVDLAASYLEQHGSRPGGPAPAALALPTRERVEHFGRWAVEHFVREQRRVLGDYGVTFDVWTSEQRDVRDRRLAEKMLEELAGRGLTYEDDGALWFRSTASEEAGDDKDRVLRRRDGEVTYFGVDIAYHHYLKFAATDRVIDLLGPDHHGYVARMRAAMQALDHPAFAALIIQLVTLLRDGQPVRMSKRRGEFVLALATRQSSDNPVYYVQYAHARIRSIHRQAAEQGIAIPPWRDVDLSPLTDPEEQALIKRLLDYPHVVGGAARALEPHRIAYWLSELAALFHPYYKTHRVIQEDRRLMLARLALCTAVGQVIANGLTLLGVSAPETM